ncbi:glycoside hydrolase [Vibrio variabilis]|uniref:Glycoside hydrolase n=1 Tax=Vibrio variabilis TaxID=990271 RepID=A0ABR4Y7B4_9VIBR|nr:glycosyltransferase family 4 protein [Vibrio variabilis]KHA59181.1 glycoside hydrolase [Vibrio variabilis]
MKVTYFINQYPMVSHSFIRREIIALERQGIEIQRVALRGWSSVLVNKDDAEEQSKTQYVLQGGLLPLLFSTARQFLKSPVTFFSALKLTLSLSRSSNRPLHLHLVSLAEACFSMPLINEFGSQHVHAHFGTNSAEVVMLINALGGPDYSFTVHGPEEFDKPQALKLREKVARAKFVVTISSFGRGQMYRWLENSLWSKVKVVHCGIEKGFHQVPLSELPDAPQLVCVGRLCEQKGQLLLLEACKKLKKDDIEFHLVLAGDGELRQDIEEFIHHHNLSKNITITGWIGSNEVRELILSSRGLVLPSFAEGLPVVIMEAMSLRRPVLTTYIAGIPELVQKDVNGWIFPSGDVNEIYLAMKEALSINKVRFEKLSNNAYERVTQRHDIDDEASKLIKYFRD